MKYYILSAIIFLLVLSSQSCKRLGDEDGNLLNNMGENNELLGEDRFLYQETTSNDTIAQYRYNGRKLVQVIGDSTVTNIEYSGDLIYKITFNGVVEGDSISYTQLYNYNPLNNNILTNITETKKIYENIANQVGPLVSNNSKSIYDVVFETGSKTKLKSILKKSGDDIPFTPFQYTTYEKSTYTYNSKNNITQTKIEYGGVSGSTLTNPQNSITFDFADYDEKKSPYLLIPFIYNLHKTFENPFNNYKLSPNNPKRALLTGDLIPIPIPFATLYEYDHISYMLNGWGIKYDYRPF